MKKYSYEEAKALIQSICRAAGKGAYDTREKFLDVLEANPDIAAQGYNSFGKIFFWNKASALLYGYNEAAAINRDVFETILPPELRQLARSMIRSAFETGKVPEPSACDLLHRDGAYLTVFSGHLMFTWKDATTPEFYCIDAAIEEPSMD